MNIEASTTTSLEAEEANQRWCSICKASKGHYTHQHEDWMEI